MVQALLPTLTAPAEGGLVPTPLVLWEEHQTRSKTVPHIRIIQGGFKNPNTQAIPHTRIRMTGGGIQALVLFKDPQGIPMCSKVWILLT